MENEKLQEQTESMADYEAHFDDANPWNVSHVIRKKEPIFT